MIKRPLPLSNLLRGLLLAALFALVAWMSTLSIILFEHATAPPACP
jgi:hypothetical protein